MEEMAGFKPWEVTNDREMVWFHLSNLGGGPVLWVTPTCQEGLGGWGPLSSQGCTGFQRPQAPHLSLPMGG